MTSMRIVGPAAFVALALALPGCASTGGSNGSGARNVITEDQLLELSSQSAYQAVQKLKPRWLQRRGQQSFRFQTTLIVVVDDGASYDLDILHQLRTDDIREIRYMNPRQATLKYGDRASGGAILVTTW